MSFITTRREAHVIEVIIDREEKNNALNLPIFEELNDVFTRIEEDDEVRTVVISGKGKNFAAGADLDMLSSANSPKEIEKAIFGTYVIDKIAECSVPVIAAIRGFAVGGGLELALAADIRIAGEDARLGLPEIRLGLIPAAGGIQRLSRLIGIGPAVELMLTGEIIGAQEAHRLGLVNRVVPNDQVVGAAWELAAKLAEGPPIATRLLKSALNRSFLTDQVCIEFGRQCFRYLLTSRDKEEGIKAFREKRTPRFQGV